MSRKYQIKIEGEERVVDVVENGEKDYLITLDGKTYQTHIEDAGGSGSGGSQPRVTVSPASAKAPAARAPEPKAPRQEAPAADGAVQILAPLTGTVISVKVAAGAKVDLGQVLCLLEAMKMEMEIVASHAGVVTTVAVKPTDTVRQGDVLFVLQAGAVN
jgi:glutaconyl-CoA/methylmalonyl-CoA decarboxylase subunit gamma